MPDAIIIVSPTINKVSDNAISMVCTLALAPVKLLTWVVLVITYLGAVSYFHQGVREVVKNTPGYRSFLSVARSGGSCQGVCRTIHTVLSRL